jgi:phage-related protein
MSGADTGEITFTISAIDDASETINQVQDSVSDLTMSVQSVGPAMSDAGAATGAATGSMNDFSQSTMWSMQGVRGLSSVVRLGIIDLETYQMTHNRLEQAQYTAQKAQEAYTEAVKKFGPASQQAIDAHQKLQDAMDRVTYYQEKENLNWIMMATQIPMIVASLTQMSAGLGSVSGALSGLSATFSGSTAALGGLAAGFGLVAGGAAVVVSTLVGVVGTLTDLDNMVKAGTATWADWNAALLVVINPIASVAAGIEYLLKDLGLIPQAVPTVADAFAKLGDAISAPFSGILKDVQEFLNSLRSTFTDFYDWLVSGGGSWTDMWNKLSTIAQDQITKFLNALNANLFEPMKTAFTTALQMVDEIWKTAWTTIQTDFDTITMLIETDLKTWLTLMETDVTAALAILQDAWNSAWQAIETTFNTITSAIQTAWKLFLDTMKTAMDLFWSTVQALTSGGLAALEAGFMGGMATIEGLVNNAISTLEAAWGAFMAWIQAQISTAESLVGGAVATIQGMLSGINATQHQASSMAQGIVDAVMNPLGTMSSLASAAGQTISSSLTGTFNAISGGATDLMNMLVGHSIWTDMLTEMQDQTRDAMANIVNTFAGGFGAVAPAVPAAGAGGIPAASTSTLQSLAGNQQTAITIPITVTLDGSVISRQMEQRTVTRIASTMKLVSATKAR